MESDGFFDIEYSSSKELYTSLQAKALKLKFSLSILRSDYKKKKVIFKCDRAGDYKSVAVERQTKTKTIGCTYKIMARDTGSGSQWKVARQDGAHNHELCDDISMHPRARRLTREQQLQRARLEKAGVKPKAQLAVLRQEHPGFSGVGRDMYNDQQKARKEYLGGRTPIQALVDELQLKEYRFMLQRDAEGHITHLLFSNPRPAALAVEFCDVVLLDCTYKTNKFSFPLLNCVGVSPFGSSFLICSAFIQREEETDYVWALSSLKRLLQGRRNHLNPRVVVSDNDAALLKAEEQVFPSATRLLCRWHINKNVLAKCKGHFKSGDEWESTLVDWNLLCGASSSDEFETRWANLQAKLHHVPAVTRYLETTWIKHKEKFVEAWVGKVFHLGCSTTSRAGSIHAYLKRFLRSSVGHLLSVFESLHLGIENQVIELRRLHADDRLKRPTFAANSVYAQVVNKVAAHALSLVHKHVSHVLVEACSTKFTVTLGLPCRHIVQARIDDDSSLAMADFDPHWWLDHFSIGSKNRSLSVSENRNVQLDDVIPRFLQVFEVAPTHQQTAIRGQLEDMILRGPSSSVMDPLASKPKGRPPGATNRHKRQRDPSAFETVEGSAQMTRKCSVCKHYGHNKRTCPNTAAV